MFIVPGSTFVTRLIKKYRPEAIVGVGCLMEVKEGLEMADRIDLLAMGVVTSKDGCVETILDWESLIEVIALRTCPRALEVTCLSTKGATVAFTWSLPVASPSRGTVISSIQHAIYDPCRPTKGVQLGYRSLRRTGGIGMSWLEEPLIGNVTTIALILFVLILVLGVLLGKGASVLIRKYLDDKVGHRLSKGVARTALYAIIGTALVVGFGMALQQQLTGLIISLGLVGVAIAFASQQIVQNMLSGVIISFTRPIQLEDWVDVGLTPTTGVFAGKGHHPDDDGAPRC